MKNNKILTTKNMVLIAMFAAIMAVLSQISFQLPGGVPITLQTFGVVLVGIILGPNLGITSILIYLLMGAVGVPVFAGFRGGFDVLVGATGGYLIGFLPMSYFVGFGKKKPFMNTIVFSITGLLICHVMGLVMYYTVTGTWILPSVPLMLAKDVSTTIVAVILGKEITKQLTFLSAAYK
jgi:biotin transport system substrate-specific component